MATTLASLAAVLKEDYVIDMITDELNENVEAYTDFDQEELAWTGKDAIFPLRVSRNQSVTASSTSTTPAAGQQGYLRLVITAKKVYGTMQIDGDALAAAAKKTGTFALEAAAELDGLVMDLRKTLAKFIFVGGPVIGYIWEKKNPGGGAAWGYSGRFADIAVGAGETVSFVRMDTYAAVGGAVQPTSITSTTLTLNANLDTSAVPAGTLIAVVVTGAQAALTENNTAGSSSSGIDAAVSAEPRGFIGNLSAVDQFGANRATNTPAGSIVLRSNFLAVDDTVITGGVLSLSDIQNLTANIQTQSSKRPDKYWMSWLQLTSYTTLLQGTSAGNLRTNVKDPAGKADPGYTDFAYANIPIKCSDVCPNGLIFAINKDSFRRATLSTGHWIDFEGTGPLKRVPNTDSATATYAIYYDLVCKQPNADGVIGALALS